MFKIIIQHYLRILKIAGSFFTVSILLLLATDSFLLDGLLGNFFEAFVIAAVISGGILILSSVIYIPAILVKITTEGLKQVSKKEFTLLLIALLLGIFLSNFFLQEFYSRPY